MPRLVFSKSGDVAVHENDEPVAFLDRDDPWAILRFLRATVELEEGMSSAQFMRALRPWGAVLSRISWCDFDAWESAISRPHLALVSKDGAPHARHLEIEAVVVCPTLQARAPRKTAATLHVRWEAVGRLAVPDEHGLRHCGLSGMAPSGWAHLPLLVERRLWLQPSGRGRCPIDGAYLVAEGVEMPSTLETTPSFMDAIALGFLDTVTAWGTPEEAARCWGEIADLADRARLSEDERPL